MYRLERVTKRDVLYPVIKRIAKRDNIFLIWFRPKGDPNKGFILEVNEDLEIYKLPNGYPELKLIQQFLENNRIRILSKMQ